MHRDLAPILFENDNREGARAQRGSSVEPVRVPECARAISMESCLFAASGKNRMASSVMIGSIDGFRVLIDDAFVSKKEQNLDLQHDALRAAGCERIFDGKASGARTERPGLIRGLAQLRDGDTLVAWRLDRLGRPLKDLIARAEQFKQMGAGPKSPQDVIDTTSSGGRMIFHHFGSPAKFERDLTRERTQTGLKAARARGRKGGRKKALTAKQRAHAVEFYRSREHTDAKICNLIGISRATLYAYFEEFSDG